MLDVVCAAACVVVGEVVVGEGAAEVVGAGAAYVEVDGVGAGAGAPSFQDQDITKRPTLVGEKNSKSPWLISRSPDAHPGHLSTTMACADFPP